MSLHWLEVAPAAPLIIDALPALLALAGLFVALGLILLIDGFVRALFGVIASITSDIPVIGGVTSSAIHSAEHALSNALGNAISGIERRIAHQFHNLARVAARLWHAIEGAAELIFALATLAAAAVTLPVLHHITRPIYRAIQRAEHTALTAIHHALRVAKAFTHSVAQGVYPRLRALEHEVARTIPREIKRTRALAREAEDEAVAAFKAAEKALANTTTKALAIALPAVIARLGWDWIKCSEARNIFNKRGCGLWNDLDGLLGLFASSLILTDVCTFLPFLESAFGAVAGPLINLLTVVPIGGCETPPQSWPKFNVPTGPLPPAQTLGPLAP